MRLRGSLRRLVVQALRSWLDRSGLTPADPPSQRGPAQHLSRVRPHQPVRGAALPGVLSFAAGSRPGAGSGDGRSSRGGPARDPGPCTPGHARPNAHRRDSRARHRCAGFDRRGTEQPGFDGIPCPIRACHVSSRCTCRPPSIPSAAHQPRPTGADAPGCTGADAPGETGADALGETGADAPGCTDADPTGETQAHATHHIRVDTAGHRRRLLEEHRPRRLHSRLRAAGPGLGSAGGAWVHRL